MMIDKTDFRSHRYLRPCKTLARLNLPFAVELRLVTGVVVMDTDGARFNWKTEGAPQCKQLST